MKNFPIIFFILSIVILLFVGLDPVQAAYPTFTPNSDLVIVGPYDTATSGAGNSGCASACASGGSREFINIGQKYRIRQTGTISRVRLYVASTASLTGFYIKIWRKNASSTYDLVGISNNIASSLTAGNFHTVDLSSPISGVQEGDYYGYRIEASGSEYETYVKAVTGVTVYMVTNETPSTTNYTWESKTAGANQAMPIELYMTAPQVAFIGDSLIAGHPAHYSFLETTAITNITSTIEKQFSNLTGYTYQNMGIGSQTTSNILSRFTNDIINLKPKVAVIYGSGNDGYSDANKATFLSNWTTMLNAAQASEYITTIIVLKLLPATSGTTVQMQAHDDWNVALTALAANYSKAIVVDANPYVGQFRSGGDAGNLWDIKTAYNQDNVHLNSAGYG